MFRFERQQQPDDLSVLTLNGRLDAVTAAALKAEVVAMAESKLMKVIVDMSRLNLIDSTGVGVLISLFKRTRSAGGQVYFAGLGGQPKEVFRLLRLDRSLDLYLTVDDARAALKKI